MPTFRALANYADAVPGSTDRMLFESSGNLPRGVAPGSLVFTISQVTGLQTALNTKITLTSPTLGAAMDCATFEVFGNRSPFQTMTGSQSSAASGRSWKITGNATAVPITNGWMAKVVNTSGSAKTITPATGSCVILATGVTQASVALADDHSCFLHGDGTNLLVDGVVT